MKASSGDTQLGSTDMDQNLIDYVEVKVPAGTQPDDVLRLKYKGLPVFGAQMHGDINIRLEVHVPEKLSSEEKALYEQLRGKGASRKGWWR